MKKLISFICVISLVCVSLAGCGKSSSKAKKIAVQGEDGPLAPYSETLTLSMLHENNVGVTYPGEDTAADNAVTRFFKEKLNIAFNMDWTVDSGNYSEQLDLAIASNTDLPDIFTADRQQVYTLAASGLIYDMEDIFEKYASDSLKETVKFADSQGIKSGTVLDGLYGLPLTNDVGDGASMVFIRKDWLNKLGLKEPTSLNELKNIAKAFVDNNVSGNKNGTLGISMAKDMGFTLDVVANACGAYPDLWVNDGNGKLTYGSLSSNMKNALQYLNELYGGGLINKEFAAQDTAKMAQYVAQGRLGIFIGPFWYNNNYIINNLTADSNAEWVVVNNLPLNSGEKVACRAWNTTYKWLVVNKKCGNPEAAVKLMNLWYEMWQGQYADWYFSLQNSEQYKTVDLKKYSPIFFDPPLKNCKLGVALREAVASGDSSALNPEGLYDFDQLMLKDNSAIYRSAMLTWYGSFEKLNSTYSSFVYDLYQGPKDTAFSTIENTLDEYEATTFTDIIMGKKDIAYFDEFVKQWKSQGGDTLTENVNEWYGKQ